MKYWIFTLSLIFLLQGHASALFSDLLLTNPVANTTSSTCHDEHSESQSQSDDCDDCFHIHTCCHVKLIESHIKYELSPSFISKTYQDFFKVLFAQSVIEGPFQPPKSI